MENGTFTNWSTLVSLQDCISCFNYVGKSALLWLVLHIWLAGSAVSSMERKRLGEGNTAKEDAIVMDASFAYHWPKFILW